MNLHATFTKGTIEFRLFQFANPTAERRGGLHAGELKSYIQLCLALSEAAKSLKTANPKFAMRTWLMRLGFIGWEFTTARDILTRNLAGDAAFRFGRAPLRHKSRSQAPPANRRALGSRRDVPSEAERMRKMKTKMYIAYGSNMDLEQMQRRCPEAELLGTGRLEKWRLMFKGSKTGAYATIEREKGKSVPILLWRITEMDEERLDRYEGFIFQPV